MTDPDPPAIPAATLILYRDRPGQAAELLFVERSAAMAFAPGAIVFPGGRIDPGDRALATGDEALARVAAIRETIEETGIAIGVTPAPDLAQVVTMRDRLLAGTPFAEALAEQRLALDPGMLVPFARWRPSHRPARVFDTRFYLAPVPANAVAIVDGRENVRLFWATPGDVLVDADAGRVSIIFPTRCNLERLARLPDFAAAVADADAHPVTLISPWIEKRTDGEHLCIPRDAGYPVTSVRLSAADRG